MRLRVAAPLALALLLSAGAALAQAGAVDEAKTLFNVGAQAYDKGEYPAAIQAFTAAYALSPRPGILFSMAQAHRKQFYIARSPGELREAVKLYRDYLGRVAEGGRRSDAAQALAELEPLAAKLDPGAPAPAMPERKVETRLGVTSSIAGATLTIDGGKALEVPFIGEVPPGKHHLVITSPGYHDEGRDIDVAPGAVAALDIALREKKARLRVETKGSADVSIDGRFVAATPLTAPLEVDAGRHLVVVSKNGYRAFGVEVELARDEDRTLDAPLATSNQRAAAWSLIGVGAASIVVGGSLSLVALHEQNVALSLEDTRKAGKAAPCPTAATCQQTTSYDDARNKRDDYRRWAAITLGGGAAVGVLGGMLFAFDQPSLGALPMRRDDAPSPKPAPPRPRDVPAEMAASPLVGPGLFGASLSGRF